MPEEHFHRKIERLGKYVVEEELGHGGMAWVFRAEDPDTQEMVAVKVLMPELTAQPAFVKRFHREIETLRNLEHPAVVRILDVGVEGDYQFYVMEYMDGPTLDKILRQSLKLTVAEALGYTRAVANALQHAHGTGLVHRDIKPANIMTDTAGNVKLADFGIAKDMEATRLTVTGGIVGTADYMSPEQAEGRRVTRKSDIYSLGVCLYEMLTGRVPFTGKTYLDVIRAHRYSLPESPRSLNPAIPGKVARLVQSMMEKDPDKRPASAAEVIGEIDAIESVGSRLGDEEREVAGNLIRWALVPAADWKTYTLRISICLVVVVGLILAAWGAKYRYFTTAEDKFALGLETFWQGRYNKAARYFDHVVYFHPDSPQADGARRMLAVVRHKNRKKNTVQRRPVKTPEALELYQQAVSLLESGRRKEAVERLRRLSADFADTKGGRKAAEKLAELETEAPDPAAQDT